MRQTFERVVWSEGMLLAPQHFQRQDAYHEALLDARLGWVLPHSWGAVALALDEAQLAEGRVALASFAGVMPGGTALRVEAGEVGAPPARTVSDDVAAAKLDVYLTLPIERGSAPSHAEGEPDSRARFVIETREVADAVGGRAREPVRFARPNAALRLGDEPRDDCESLKIAEITRDANGALRYVCDYVAPGLRVAASARLVELLRGLLVRCVAKWRALAALPGPRAGGATECTLDDLARMQMLHVLGGAIPRLTSLVGGADATPHAAYLVLVQLAGELAAFTPALDPSALPPYLHTDLRATFAALAARLDDALRVGVAGRVATLTLDARVDGMHLARLDALVLDAADACFFLAVRAAVPEATLRGLMPKVAKVASWSDIPRHVGAAVSGVAVTHAPRPPRALRTDAGRQYFVLDTSSGPWRGVLDERALAVHLPPPFDPATTTVELVALTVGA